MSRDTLQDVRLSDLMTFLTVKRLRSMAAASRELKVTPSQVTKAIARLETQLGVSLLTRSGRGVVVSDAGNRLAPELEELIERLRNAQRREQSALPVLTLGAPSFLYHLFLPRVAVRMQDVRLRGFEMAPTALRALAGEDLFDLALMLEAAWMPAQWVLVEIGKLRSGLFAAPEVAKELGAGPVPVERIREVPFVGPLYLINGQLLRGEDHCPLPFPERRIGHEAQTILTALEVAASSRQVVFGPAIAAGPMVTSGRLQEIKVDGWNVSAPLYLATNGDRVRARLQTQMVAALRESLKELETQAR